MTTEEKFRDTDVGVEPPIEDAILALRKLPAFRTDEAISDELLLAGVLVIYKSLRKTGTEEDLLAPYDRAIRFLIETREDVREVEGHEFAPVDTTWPRYT